jgi:hypothetical protein
MEVDHRRCALTDTLQNRADLHRRPLSIACRCHTASIQRAGDAAIGGNAARPNFADDRRDVAGEAIGLGLRARYGAMAHVFEPRISEHQPPAFAALNVSRVRCQISDRSFSASGGQIGNGLIRSP